MSKKKSTIFITGTTGNLGGRILLQALEDHPNSSLMALVRGRSQIDAQLRICNTLKIYAPAIDFSSIGDRLKVVCGDITDSRLGLAESEYYGLSQKVTHIIHAAAATKFGSPLSEAKRINVSGTENVVKFAREGSHSGVFPMFAHISTAFVCGNREGEILESDMGYQSHFSNSYEQSKFEAEQLVRQLIPSKSLKIFRPSIIVGDSATGRIATFNVLYPILRLISQGLIKVLPGCSDIGLDIIPVDYAARAILHIFLQNHTAIENTFNIVCGKENMMTAGEIVHRTIYYLLIKNSGDRLDEAAYSHKEPRWDPFAQPSAKDRISSLFDTYRPYLNLKRYFDNQNTQFALNKSGIVTPKMHDYFDNVLKYSLETDWGKALKSAA